MSRRNVLKVAGAAAAASAMPAGTEAETPAPKPRPERPNVVFILVDDLGYGDLACYGAKDMRTPHIDALMAGGMRFDRFYANCPVCSPTRAAALTGRYPDLVGVPGVIRTRDGSNFGHLTAEAVLLPSVLKPAGYHTAIVGKWHLGLASPNTPTERGFDHFHGFLGDMMESYYTHRRDGHNYMRLGTKTINPTGHATDLFTEWACGYLRQRAEAKTPFFLYLAYNAPHTPIQPPAEWVERVTKRQPGIGKKRASLVALIEHLDDGIGEVLATLKQTGAAAETLVIFASDNGGQGNVGADNGPLRGAKQDMYEGGIRVPMGAVWTGRIAPGSRSDRVALTMDLFPTICAAARASFDHAIDGRSILPTLCGRPQPAEDRTLFWVRREGGRYQGQAYYAARRGKWKLLQNAPGKPFELYDLDADPAEKHPLGPDHPVYAELLAVMRKRIAAGEAVPWRRPE